MFFLLTALPTCILSLPSSRKKNARQYFQILVDLEKIPKALTAEIVLIKSLNIWKNKNKQTIIEYDFLFNRINRFYMRKFFF